MPFPPPSTSVPPIVFTPEGLIVPTDTDVLAGAQADLNTAFGGGVNPALETPQGQIASSETAVISDKNSEIVLLVNQIDPQYSTGRFQDAIARIYYLNRQGATSTAVTCDLGGLVNTPIPAGTLAQDTSGNTYVLQGDVTIPAGGAVSSTWQNVATGPIPCPAGTLTKVYQAIPGWDTIVNLTDGILGQNVESPSEFEFRRKQSVAVNGHGTPPAIYGSVFEVANVLDAYVIDNPEAETVLTGATNYPVVEHSIYVAVVGGKDEDIAQAIWVKKDAGCNYNGNTTVVVTDPSGYNFPPPTYPVKFERPNALPILFAVQLVNDPTLPTNTVDLVKAAIVARFGGADGTSRERIGSIVLASRYYSAIALAVPTAVLLGVLVGTVTPTATNVPVGIDQAPTLNPDDITVSFV